MMAARILGLSSLILSASLVSRAQAFPCDGDQGWLTKEDAKCTGTDQTSCSAAQCCKERTCASIASTGLACPTGTTAKADPEAISSCSGDDDKACVAEKCCEGMTCKNIGDHLELACPGTAKAGDTAIADPGAWYASCCVLPTCGSLVDDCADDDSDPKCTCKAGYSNVAAGSVFNKQLGSGGDADKFLVQCCVLPTCEASASGDNECPVGQKFKEVGYNSKLAPLYPAQCCEWKTCSEAAVDNTDLACAEGTVASVTDTWNAATAANAFQATCCKTKSCATVASEKSDVECDGDKTFVEDKQYDSSGSNFDVDAFKKQCCEPIFVCADYRWVCAPTIVGCSEPSPLFDGGLRTAYPRIVAAAIGGSAMLWGSWAARSAAS